MYTKDRDSAGTEEKWQIRPVLL